MRSTLKYAGCLTGAGLAIAFALTLVMGQLLESSLLGIVSRRSPE